MIADSNTVTMLSLQAELARVRQERDNFERVVKAADLVHIRLRHSLREACDIGLRRCDEWHTLHGKSSESTAIDEQANEIDMQLLERLRAQVQP